MLLVRDRVLQGRDRRRAAGGEALKMAARPAVAVCRAAQRVKSEADSLRAGGALALEPATHM